MIWYQEGDDIGQLVDPSARVILRVHDPDLNQPVDEFARGPVRIATREPRRMEVVEVVRFPLDIPYTSLVRTLVSDFRRPELVVGANPPRMAVDITGVGRGVYDMLREAGVGPMGITITSGATAHNDKGIWYVPKRDLVMAAVLGMEQKTLLIGSEVPGCDLLVQELRAFKVKTTATGRESYAASEEWREGDHDDIVLALAIAVWAAARRPAPQPTSYAKIRR